jgi:hypothetical protein
LEKIGKIQPPGQVSQEDVASNSSDYDKVIWIHTQYTPQEGGIELLAKSLGIDKSKIVVPNARTAQQLLSGQGIPDEINNSIQESKRKSSNGLYGWKNIINGCQCISRKRNNNRQSNWRDNRTS